MEFDKQKHICSRRAKRHQMKLIKLMLIKLVKEKLIRKSEMKERQGCL